MLCTIVAGLTKTPKKTAMKLGAGACRNECPKVSLSIYLFTSRSHRHKNRAQSALCAGSKNASIYLMMPTLTLQQRDLASNLNLFANVGRVR